MEDGFGGENNIEAAARRAREAQELIDKPRVDMLKAELERLKEPIQARSVYDKETFVRQFEEALAHAKRFAEVVFPSQSSS